MDLRVEAVVELLKNVVYEWVEDVHSVVVRSCLTRELKDLQLTQKHSVGKKNRKLEKSSHQSPVTMQLYVSV